MRCQGGSMRAISVKQPHADRIRRGEKTMEVRSWRTHHRGPLLICSSQRPQIDGLPAGVTRAIVDVHDCRPFMPEDAAAACIAWAPGQWAWCLRHVTATSAVRVKGKLKIFDFPAQ